MTPCATCRSGPAQWSTTSAISLTICIPQRSTTSGSSRRCVRTAPISRGSIGLDVRFSADGALAPLPRDVAVCLYRIVQEGLRNFANHAGVRDASVSLTQTPDLVELTIVDRGRGFDPDGAAARRGLGLLSIEERARLVGGTFKITSTPDRGTALHVQVPARALAVPGSVQIDSFSSEGAPLSELLPRRDDDGRTA